MSIVDVFSVCVSAAFSGGDLLVVFCFLTRAPLDERRRHRIKAFLVVLEKPGLGGFFGAM